jgi:hypothetical protein
MARRSWTELFFLDEATAFAAGHRPCFFCRPNDAKRFRAAWEKGNDVSGISAKAMDEILHRERLDHGKKRLHALPVRLEELPDGTMVQQGGESFLVTQGAVWLWSFAGYVPHAGVVDRPMLLTPPSTLRAIASGYQPALHPTARR